MGVLTDRLNQARDRFYSVAEQTAMEAADVKSSDAYETGFFEYVHEYVRDNWQGSATDTELLKNEVGANARMWARLEGLI